ncbi:Hypothetical predicted protein [Mytilus galloprovincialis]|uniref:Uncharacterized protein n=1 Tax=Mytilus galloprovincialis TaxID=29158 RepID=A0A8B6CIT5_MYTGA|nr:Hypothetical predicted protein [Mytilus galloprovincialis]
MASTLNISGGLYGYEDISKNAKKWYAICDEGICGECEKYHISMKVTRGHKMISIEDYRQIENISVNLNCETHGKKLHLYCKKHDVACFLERVKKTNQLVTTLSFKEEMRFYMESRLEIEIHHMICSLMKEVRQFGEIKVIETMTNFQLKDSKIDQAQIQIQGGSQSIQNVNLKLKEKFNIIGSKSSI